MRLLGCLFLVLLLLGAFGWFRGWFSVTTARAGESVTVHVDENRIRDDSRAAKDRLADTSAKIGAIVKSLGRRIRTDETVLHGTITAIDAVERDLTVRVVDDTNDPSSMRLRIPASVALTRDGNRVTWDDVRLGSLVQLTFVDAGEERHLVGVELLP